MKTISPKTGNSCFGCGADNPLGDEVSSKVLSALGKTGVTRNIEVSYEKPVSLSRPIRIEAKLVRLERRKHFIEAQILNSDGDVLAKSHALFLSFAQRD